MTTQIEGKEKKSKTTASQYQVELHWLNIIVFSILHLCVPYTFYLGFTTGRIWTWIFSFVYGNLAMLGVTAGSHRLWSHRSYKAKLPLRILLAMFYSMCGQMDLYQWSRDHRLHHKYNNTDADPHTVSRGFFFSHIGWILCKEHPDVTAKEKTIILDDLLADPVVRFHKRFRYPVDLFFVVILPTIIPFCCWHESPPVAFLAALTRYLISLHVTFLINSVAHIYGDRPYDKGRTAAENPICSFMTLGEGWHNYHHSFPNDYSASELGWELNLAKVFIDLMAKVGQAYDLKIVDPELVQRRKERTGDGSRRK